MLESILRKAPPEIRQKMKNRSTENTYEEIQKRRIQKMNDTIGKLTGCDCKICKNKGVVYYIDDGYELAKKCECMEIRESLHRIQRSGISDLLKEYTFDKFQTISPWQNDIKTGALRFLDDHDRKWFFIGGQVGSGKTHICTAVVGEFLNRGINAKYMLWRDEAVKLKAVVNDDASYSRLINPLKSISVLYIDDFFRTGSDENGRKKPPTQGDINIAFEIINYRYNNNLATIISSELTVDDVISLDEAVGSRIYQRTKEYNWSVSKDPQRNYRLK